MNDKQRQTTLPPPESDVGYDELVDMVADSMKHAIGVQRQAREATIQLAGTATAHTESVKAFDASLDTLLRELPFIVADKIGEKFNKAAENAATTISLHLGDANKSVINATAALTKASSLLRSQVEAEFTRRIWIGGISFLGGSVFGAFLVGLFVY